MRNFTAEDYDRLASKATQHAAKLISKEDQCRAILECAHLFWPVEKSLDAVRDDKRVLACLQRSLKIANNCMGSQVHLFVDILNKYLFFFDKGCASVRSFSFSLFPLLLLLFISFCVSSRSDLCPIPQRLDRPCGRTPPSTRQLRCMLSFFSFFLLPSRSFALAWLTFRLFVCLSLFCLFQLSKTVKLYYANTLTHIKMKQALNNDVAARYLQISAPDDETESS
jgi:hypothetical protein